MAKRASAGASPPDTFSIERLRNDLQEFFKRFEVIQQRSELIRALDRAILNITWSPREVLALLVEQCCKHTASQHAQVVVLRRNRLVVEASTEPARVDTELPFESLCGKAIREGVNQNCPNVSALPPRSYVRFHKSTKSELAILIKPERASRVLGVLNLERSRPLPFDEETVAFAELLAGQAAIAIEQARVWKSVDMVQSISATLLAGEMTLWEAFNEILHTVLEALNFEHGQILRRDGSELLIIASSRQGDLGLRIGPENSVCGRYLIAEQGRENLRIPDIAASDYAASYLALLRGEGAMPMRSELIVPLIRENRLIGALNLESPQVGAFSEIDEKLLSVVAELMGHAMFATFGRTSRVHRSRIEAANLAMTHLGQAAQDFLHRFGSDVGYVRGHLKHLRKTVVNKTTDRKAAAEAETRIQDLVATLDKASAVLGEFANNFNPDGPKFQVQRMDLAEVAQRAVDKFVKAHPNESIEVVFRSHLPFETNSDGEPVTGKSLCELSYQVYDVLENLLSNARDAIRDRQRLDADESYRGLIEVILDLPDPLYPRLQVIDNGIGIPEEIQKKIFDFGFSTKGRTGGGIGLWFCEYYVALRGGHIRCRSALGRETVFEIQFPASFQDA